MLSKKNKAWLWETGLVAHKEDTDFRELHQFLREDHNMRVTLLENIGTMCRIPMSK